MAKYSIKKSASYKQWEKERYSGYKTVHSAYGNSSFWLDDDFLSKEKRTYSEGIDFVKMAGYKRAISNFVRIVTGKTNIPVKFSSGKNSYTNGQEVVISSALDQKEFDATVGLALHEGSHIAMTDFKTLNVELSVNSNRMYDLIIWYNTEIGKGTGNKSTHDVIPQIKDLFNIIEDRRIDYFVYTSAPGYHGYYQALYNKYFNSPAIDKALLEGKVSDVTYDNYVFHICNFTNANRQLDALPGLRDIWNLIDLKSIGRLKNSTDVIEVAGEVWKLIQTNLNNNEQSCNNPTEKKEDEKEQEESKPYTQENKSTDPNLDRPESKSGDDDDAPQGNKPTDPKQAKKDAKDAKALKEAIEKQKAFLKGDIKKKALSKQDAIKVNAASESNMSYSEVGGLENNTGIRSGKTSCMVIKGITDALIKSDILGTHLQSEHKKLIERKGLTDYVEAGITLGTMLGKRLKTRDEERFVKSTRQETGKIDRRLISELGFNNERVFAQTTFKTVTPALVHISLDASGSMIGDKWKTAMKTAIAIAKAGSMVSSLDVIISIRGCIHNNGINMPLMWTIYDSRTDSFNSVKEKFYMPQAAGSTPEGLCYEAVMKDIIKSANGKEAYIINICDGEPGFSNRDIDYGGQYALLHSKQQVEKMRKSGINVLSYFVHGDYITDRALGNHYFMYGKDAQNIDLDNLNQLSRSLNNLFERAV